MKQSRGARRKAQNDRKRADIISRLMPNDTPLEEDDRVRIAARSPICPNATGFVAGFVTHNGQDYVRVRFPGKRNMIARVERCHVEKQSAWHENALVQEREKSAEQRRRVFEFDGPRLNVVDRA